MKTPSNELKELINTLTPAEKNKFKDYCKSKRDAGTIEYLKLFAVYCGKSFASDSEIKQAHKFKNLPRIKAYLNQQLFNFLTETAQKSVDKDLCDMIVLAEVLIKRSLFKQSLAVLAKAKNLANLEERYNYTLIINQKTMNAHNYLRNVDYWNYYTQEYRDKEFAATINKLVIDQDVQSHGLNMTRFQVRQDELLRSPEALKEFEKTLLPLLKKGDDYPQTIASKFQYNSIVGYYYLQLNNFDKAIFYIKHCCELYDQNKYLHSTRPMFRVITLGNLMCAYATGKKFEELKQVLLKLNSLHFKDKFHASFALQLYWVYESNYCKNRYDYPNRKKSLKKLELDFLKQYTEVFIQNKIPIVTNISINYFIDGNPKKALEWLNKLDEYSTHTNYKSLFAVIRLYRLIIYFEMDKIDLLQYSIANTYRSLQHSNLLFNLEKVLIKMLGKLLEENSPKYREQVYKVARAELEPLKKDNSVWHVLLIFNFMGWLDCKIESTNFNHLMNK